MNSVYLIMKEYTASNGATVSQPVGYVQSQNRAKEYCREKNSYNVMGDYEFSYQIIEEIKP